MTTRVLVVDDNEDNLRIVGQILRRRGYEVFVVRDGPSALAALASEHHDIVILDVMMPEMDGFQVLDRIRADPRSARVPVILLTAKAEDEDVLAGYKCGADYYITKPFTARRLLHGIALVLGDAQPE